MVTLFSQRQHLLARPWWAIIGETSFAVEQKWSSQHVREHLRCLIYSCFLAVNERQEVTSCWHRKYGDGSGQVETRTVRGNGEVYWGTLAL